jgi:hypothetical protein
VPGGGSGGGSGGGGGPGGSGSERAYCRTAEVKAARRAEVATEAAAEAAQVVPEEVEHFQRLCPLVWGQCPLHSTTSSHG